MNKNEQCVKLHVVKTNISYIKVTVGKVKYGIAESIKNASS